MLRVNLGHPDPIPDCETKRLFVGLLLLRRPDTSAVEPHRSDLRDLGLSRSLIVSVSWRTRVYSPSETFMKDRIIIGEFRVRDLGLSVLNLRSMTVWSSKH